MSIIISKYDGPYNQYRFFFYKECSPNPFKTVIVNAEAAKTFKGICKIAGCGKNKVYQVKPDEIALSIMKECSFDWRKEHLTEDSYTNQVFATYYTYRIPR